MEYDEIRITTQREIEICMQAITRIKKCILELETAALSKRNSMHSPDQSRQHLLVELAALERWQRRLGEHRRIMEL